MIDDERIGRYLARWTVLRVADRHVRNGMALDWVTSALGLE
jgi:hypothetical protein